MIHIQKFQLSWMTKIEQCTAENPTASDSFEAITQKQFHRTSSCSNQNMTWKQHGKDWAKYG